MEIWGASPSSAAPGIVFCLISPKMQVILKGDLYKAYVLVFFMIHFLTGATYMLEQVKSQNYSKYKDMYCNTTRKQN